MILPQFNFNNNSNNSNNNAMPTHITSGSNELRDYNFNDLIDVLNNYSESMTNAQRKENEYWFNKTNEFNSYMANTQYQRMVQDLEKAGLSKLLAYNNSPNNIVSSNIPNSARGNDLNGFLGSLVSSVNSSMTSTSNTFVKGIFDLLKAIIGSAGSFAKLLSSS